VTLEDLRCGRQQNSSDRGIITRTLTISIIITILRCAKGPHYYQALKIMNVLNGCMLLSPARLMLRCFYRASLMMQGGETAGCTQKSRVLEEAPRERSTFFCLVCLCSVICVPIFCRDEVLNTFLMPPLMPPVMNTVDACCFSLFFAAFPLGRRKK
jgi:hypothetical protein